MHKRDVLVRKSVMRDYPKINQWSLVNRSTENKMFPEHAKKAIRVSMDMNGMIFEDAPDIKGSKMIWVLQ